MQKVFVLIGDWGYDGSNLMGVYSTRELAEQAYQKFGENKTYMAMLIEEHEIDADAHIKW